MKISRTVVYATHAMLHLGRGEPGVPIPCSQLAQSGQLPERFLLQILRTLVTHGLLRSTRGVVGGYCLAKSPAEITIWDIIEAFENPLELSGSTLRPFSPAMRSCLSDALQAASGKARAELRKLTLAGMLRVDAASAGPPALDAIRLPDPPSLSVDV